jgi:hypothetical protein
MSNIFSSKSHFVQPNVVCPAPAVPAVPTFCTPACHRCLQLQPRKESVKKDAEGQYFGPSGVRALPLAAGINVGGHYKGHFFLLSPPPPGSLLILPKGVIVGF